MSRFFLFLTAFILITFSSATAQTKAQKRAAENARIENIAKEAFEKNEFVIVVDRIFPIGGKAQYSSDGYFVKISGDTLNCYLPFFGSAHSPAVYSTNLSVDLKDEIVKVVKGETKKGEYTFNLDVLSSKDQKSNEIFKFYISFYGNANASINLISSNRDSMSYHGKLKTEK
ncbi:MAG: hypothetical protein ACD_77C00369G0002 [uncultured bacterium]|nr:MAG: hypothetical protein ACD_77C00369G0002 [uncultured bacterium]HBY02537.1 hypothetical protein [Rikenellaceae bacterium]